MASMSDLPRVVLKPRRARPFFARHPWVLASSIDRVEGDARPGSEAAVYSYEGKFVARGLWNPNSSIRARLYRWDDEPLDEAFWRDRITQAVKLRDAVRGPTTPGSARRLVFSESDGLSGLVVDRYDRRLVVQCTSLALFERRDVLVKLLVEATGAEGVVLRTERGTAAKEGLEPYEETAFGAASDGPVEILEHGLTYRVDLGQGQKTGFYLDQSDNRKAAAALAGGRRVLDLYCYTGAFAIEALRNGGASHAFGIDSSAKAIEAARANAVANGAGSARFEAADVMESLDRLRSSGETFGMVVCDPPKFAAGAQAVESALKAYLRLNVAAIAVLEPGGILVTCSCSGHVDRGLFTDVLGRAAELSGRTVRILEQRGQAADHPVSASCLETDYLKCFLCHVA